ncbi:MAG: hypothetical protein ACK559_06905, partial [bacterium]
MRPVSSGPDRSCSSLNSPRGEQSPLLAWPDRSHDPVPSAPRSVLPRRTDAPALLQAAGHDRALALLVEGVCV